MIRSAFIKPLLSPRSFNRLSSTSAIKALPTIFSSKYSTTPSFFTDDHQPTQNLLFSSPTPFNWGIAVVPQQQAWVIERFGKFQRVLSSGLHFLIPFIDSIAYVHSLKEEAHRVAHQTAITKDNVTVEIDGVLYMKITDPYLASYGVSHPKFSLTQLAQTTMRSELGKITLDNVFSEREHLNANIVKATNVAASSWGICALRYEIRDITPPVSVKSAMDRQAEAERRKRAMILDSEGQQQSAINEANGLKQATILRAEGEAASILARAEATAVGLRKVAASIAESGGKDAVALRVAEQYVSAFGNLAKESTTMLLPASANDAGSMIAQALSVFKTVNKAAEVSNPANEIANARHPPKHSGVISSQSSTL